MTCLVYCIMRENGPVPGRLPPAGNGDTFPEGVPVRVVADQGLAAAISHVVDSEVTPTVRRLRTFAGVVEALHETRTVLPMRYGCLLPTEARVVALLRERGPQFVAALDGVEECAEMSIRAILDEKRIAALRALAPFDPPEVSGGTAYLAARKAYYARQTGYTLPHGVPATTAFVERVAAVFRGLFVRYVSEFSPYASAPYNVPMLSLHFLVRRAHIDPFRRMFRALDLGTPSERCPRTKMLLSGPWPPYNFVGTPCRKVSPEPLL